MKIPLDQMKFLYEISFQSALKVLFEDNQDKHGWTFEEYKEALVEEAWAIQESGKQAWVH